MGNNTKNLPEKWNASLQTCPRDIVRSIAIDWRKTHFSTLHCIHNKIFSLFFFAKSNSSTSKKILNAPIPLNLHFWFVLQNHFQSREVDKSREKIKRFEDNGVRKKEGMFERMCGPHERRWNLPRHGERLRETKLRGRGCQKRGISSNGRLSTCKALSCPVEGKQGSGKGT